MIDSIEYHEENLPDGKTWEDAGPLFAIIPGWAYERGLLAKEVAECDVFQGRYQAFKNGQQEAHTFVEAALDGSIAIRMFKKEAKKFVNEYFALGTYFADLERFFEAPDIYSIPSSWPKLATFYGVLDERLETFDQSGEFPVFRKLRSAIERQV